ncbi:MAG: hypothetical protein VB814_04915, partial [Pirellulaceae bacterium]
MKLFTHLSTFRLTLLVGALAYLTTTGCGDSVPDINDKSGSAGTTANTSLTNVTLQLNWFPEAEHGGYYAALVHG